MNSKWMQFEFLIIEWERSILNLILINAIYPNLQRELKFILIYPGKHREDSNLFSCAHVCGHQIIYMQKLCWLLSMNERIHLLAAFWSQIFRAGSWMLTYVKGKPVLSSCPHRTGAVWHPSLGPHPRVALQGPGWPGPGPGLAPLLSPSEFSLSPASFFL